MTDGRSGKLAGWLVGTSLGTNSFSSWGVVNLLICSQSSYLFVVFLPHITEKFNQQVMFLFSPYGMPIIYFAEFIFSLFHIKNPLIDRLWGWVHVV